MLLDDRDHPVADLDTGWHGYRRAVPRCSLRSLVWTILPLRKASDDQVLRRVRDEVADDIVEQRGRAGERADLAAAQKTLGSRSGTHNTRSEKLRSASNCHSETSSFSQWWSPSERSVCSEMISDIDGMSQIYGRVKASVALCQNLSPDCERREIARLSCWTSERGDTLSVGE